MNAELIARALGGKKAGASWVALCPAHKDRKKPSLALRDGDGGRVLVHCHAGCEQEAVIDALRARGLWGSNGSARLRGSIVRGLRAAGPDDAKRESALAIWQAAKPAQGSLVETYLASRGIHLPPPGAALPSCAQASLRQHLAGMIGLVTNGVDGTPLAIHRTFLAHDGRGKAPVSPRK